MNKSPAFQFYVKDFLTDDKVAAMNMEARGVYITLLSYCWNNNGLTTDREELKEMCGNPINWEKIWKKVGKCFYENSGKLFNKRLDKERIKQGAWKEKSSKGGKESAKIRWGDRGNNKGGYKKVKTKMKAKGNSSSSSPSSSSSSIASSLKPKKDTKVSFMSSTFKNNIIFKWNELAQKHNLAAIMEIKSGSLREKNLRARSADDNFDFVLLIDMINNSPFLLGKTKNPFFVFFDWIIKPTNYQKIIEGNYLDRQSYQRFSGIIQGIKNLEKKYAKEKKNGTKEP